MKFILHQGRLLCTLLLLMSALLAKAQPTIVTSGDVYDTSGNLVKAVEGGIMQVGSLYYYWGLDRSQNNYYFSGVNLYSSPDLKTWTFVNTILSKTSNAALNNNAVVERPKLLYNASTGQFVLWMHYEGYNAYSTAEVAYATCSTIGGNYTFQSHFRPLGLDSRDMNTYTDTDGKAYLICSISTNSQVSIIELNAAYTTPVQEVFRGSASAGIGCEGHAIIKKNGTYFWIQSLCSGWETNDNRYYTATSLAGPWTSRGLIAPTGTHTYQSQVTYAFPVTGTSGTTYVYMGDRWVPSNFSATRMVMLPLYVSGTSLSMTWYDQWSIDTATGIWQPGASITWSGNYRIVNRNSGLALGVVGASTANAALVTQMTPTTATSQLWTIQNTGGGEYRIDNVNSGQTLEIGGSSRTVGAPAEQYPWNGGFNQKWNIIASGGGYYRLINVNTLGKDLEVAAASTADGASVGLGEFSSSNHEMWSFMASTVTASVAAAPAEDLLAYPNPITSQGTFSVELRQASPVSIRIYQASTGALVRELTYNTLGAGKHQLTWDAADLQPGLYIYKTLLNDTQKLGKLLKIEK